MRMKKIAGLIVLICFVFLPDSFSVVRSQTNGRPGEQTGKSLKSNPVEIQLPFLEKEPVIDADLNEWKDFAYLYGVWHIYHVCNSYWYSPDSDNRV
jgi:hypothetical protein